MTKEELLGEIEVKDYFIDENGNEVHYSWREMTQLVRAKYMYFCCNNEADFAGLSLDALENIKKNLDFIKAKIPAWRKERPVEPQSYPIESPYLKPPSSVRTSELLSKIHVKDHFVDEQGRKQYYCAWEMNALLRSKYRRFNLMDEFDFSRFYEWTLLDICMAIDAMQRNILEWRKEPPYKGQPTI